MAALRPDPSGDHSEHNAYELDQVVPIELQLTMTPSPEISTSMYNMHNSMAAFFVPALAEPKHLSTKLGTTSDRVLSEKGGQVENHSI